MYNDETGRLSQLVDELGTKSRWALKTALDAAEAEGIQGYLVIAIPAKVKDRPEVSFTVGVVDLITRWDA